MCCWCCVHEFFDWFGRQATISCYTFSLFSLCVLMLRGCFFLIDLADRPPLVVIWVCFLCVVDTMWMFFDWLNRQATISCYMCVFLFVLCSWCNVHVFLEGLADKPLIVAIRVGFCVFEFVMRCAGFLVRFSRQVTISCYICVSVCFLIFICVFDAIRTVFFDWLLVGLIVGLIVCSADVNR